MTRVGIKKHWGMKTYLFKEFCLCPHAIPFPMMMIVKNLPDQQEPPLKPAQSPAKIRLLKGGEGLD